VLAAFWTAAAVKLPAQVHCHRLPDLWIVESSLHLISKSMLFLKQEMLTQGLEQDLVCLFVDPLSRQTFCFLGNRNLVYELGHLSRNLVYELGH
jgi:hypothetical protein